MNITPIGLIHSCFKEKFAIPRQPLLANAAKAELELLPPYNDPAALEGLDCVTHVWLIFGFHGVTDTRFRPKVRPPRLGGNDSMGVFATRSTYRPNQLGLSVVKLDGIKVDTKSTRLLLSGVDLLDQTPIYDIKPYVPYADALSNAQNTLASQSPALLPVIFDDAVLDWLNSSDAVQASKVGEYSYVELQTLITQVLQQDPAPAYHAREPGREYGMQLNEVNVRWCYCCLDQLEDLTQLGNLGLADDKVAIRVIAISVMGD